MARRRGAILASAARRTAPTRPWVRRNHLYGRGPRRSPLGQRQQRPRSRGLSAGGDTAAARGFAVRGRRKRGGTAVLGRGVGTAGGGHHRTAVLLLQAPADPDAALHGHTPLMAAASRGSAAVVRVLLHRGADPHRTDAPGRTARHMARELSGKDPGSGTASAWCATTTGAEPCASAGAGPPSRFGSGARSLCRRGPSPSAAPRRHVSARHAAGTGC
ncbi:ankyrin repeat domain-containing protein [Streptomyces sioyaensis]|uniref:ankyrin repeat domain-containing protein n=1 Tax=Streptomyces sioyaensis TaxID=67364 RepID=UPI0037D22D4A